MKGPFSVAQASESSGFLFWRAATLWERGIRARLEPLGLTHTQFVLLASLRWLGGASQAELSRHSGCDSMTVSAVVRTLAARGWVDRSDDEHDRRAKRLVMTASGAALVDAAVPRVEAFDRAFFEERLGAETPAFLRALRAVGSGSA